MGVLHSHLTISGITIGKATTEKIKQNSENKISEQISRPMPQN